MNGDSITSAELERVFIDSGALLEGHFALSSGLHSDRYFQCALLLSDPKMAERLGRLIAAAIPDSWPKPDIVVSPAMGGVVIGHETARALGVRSLFTERQNGAMSLRRGFSIRPGQQVLVVEDVITTGKSSGEVIDLLRSLGARIVGLAAIVLRGEPSLDVPIRFLARLPALGISPADCALCAKGIPAIKPGSRPGAPS